MHYQFFIVNKYGILIFGRTFAKGVTLSSNDMIRFASTLHSLHAISAQITPTGLKKEGIHTINATHFKLFLYQTPTGIKFCLISDHTENDMESLCRRAYQLYSDHVMKNPFYEADQQIKLESFDAAIEELLAK